MSAAEPHPTTLTLFPRSASRTRDALSDHVIGTTAFPDSQFLRSFPAVQGFAPLGVALGGRLQALANMNRTVHIPTYNKVIQSVVAKSDSEPDAE